MSRIGLPLRVSALRQFYRLNRVGIIFSRHVILKTQRANSNKSEKIKRNQNNGHGLASNEGHFKCEKIESVAK
jgi:hypothetical protein